MYKTKKILAACMSVCMLSSTISPVIQAFASTENLNLKGEIREEENFEVASPSNAQSTAINYLQQNSDLDLDEWLEENYSTDKTLNFSMSCKPYFIDYITDEEESIDLSDLKFKISIYDYATDEVYVEDIMDINNNKEFVSEYALKANNIYYIEAKEVYEDVDVGEKYCEFDLSEKGQLLLPITKEAVEGLNNASPRYIVDNEENENPDIILLTKSWYDDWYLANTDDSYTNWSIDEYEFYNYLFEGVNVKFIGKKDYTINGEPCDASKFEFTIENETRSIPNSMDRGSNSHGTIYDIIYSTQDGKIESPAYKLNKMEYAYINVYESTKQPRDTANHQYQYDDSEYRYRIFWIDENEMKSPMSSSGEDYFMDTGLYYVIDKDDYYSDPIKAKQDENGNYIIPDNNFVNKEFVQGTKVRISGKNDYKVNGIVADASEFKYRLTGWPGVDGAIDLECDADGTIYFPEATFLGFDEGISNTITVFQITKQPEDNEMISYSYDPNVYQFKLDFVTKEDASKLGISTEGIDSDYLLIYKDYTDLTWKIANLTLGEFIIDGIDFINRVDTKEASTFTVQFDSNGGSCTRAYTDIKKGTTINAPEDPVKENYEFDAWYKDKDLTIVWNFDEDTVIANTTLYAKWNEVIKPDNSENGNQTIHGGSSGSGGGSSSGSSYTVTDPGWFKNNGIWYYKDYRSNSLKKGWHLDPNDRYWYYLDLSDGHMFIGWNLIDGKWYYFNPEELAPNQTWFIGSNGRWYYNNEKKTKPFGSMYANEKTPDNYIVNEKGELIQ